MEPEFRLKNRLLERGANLFPYLILATYIAGSVFCVWIDRMSYLINGSILAIPAIIGSFAFIYIKKKDLDLRGTVELFRIRPSTSAMLFLLVSTLTVLILQITPPVSKLGFLGVIALYATITLQIVSRGLRPPIVLVEVMISLAITIYSYTLRPALYFGATDILPHIEMSTITYLTGHIIPTKLGSYAHFPLYHIFVASASHVLGLDIQASLFITTCVIYASTVLFLYGLINGIFRNEQISLLIVVAYAMNANVIYNGTYMVTRTMAYVGLLLLLYLIYTQANPKMDAERGIGRPTAWRVCVVVTVLFILLVHHISTPMIILLLGALLFLERFIRSRRYINLVLLAVPVVLFASYWTFFGYSFFNELLPRTEPSLYKTVVITEIVYVGWSFLINQIDTLLIVFFALIGAIYLIWKQKPVYSIALGLLGLASVALNVPSVLTMVFQLMSILRIDRFALLLLPFLGVVMGVGIFLFARGLFVLRVPSRWIGALLIVLVVFYGIGSLGLVKSEPGYKKYSFDYAEKAGFDHVLETVPSGSALHSDYYTCRFFGRKEIEDSDRLGLPYYNIQWLQNSLFIPGNAGYVIILNHQFRRGGLFFVKDSEFDPESSQPFLPTEENARNLTRKLSLVDKVYSDDGVDLYRFMF